LIGHRLVSPAQGCADASPEAERAGQDPGRDANEREGRRRAGAIVDEKSDDEADHDCTREETSESDEVTTSKTFVGALIGHPPKSLSSAGMCENVTTMVAETAPPMTCDVGVKLPQPVSPANPGIGALGVASVVMFGGRFSSGMGRLSNACEN
jgi:hypothetical protein